MCFSNARWSQEYNILVVEGLLKAVRDQNVKNYSVDVEKRDLKEYEVD